MSLSLELSAKCSESSADVGRGRSRIKEVACHDAPIQHIHNSFIAIDLKTSLFLLKSTFIWALPALSS